MDIETNPSKSLKFILSASSAQTPPLFLLDKKPDWKKNMNATINF